MKSATGTIQRTAQLRTVFIDIILLLLTKTDKHIELFQKVEKNTEFRLKSGVFSGASVLIGLFKKRCHTNGFSDFRVADFLVFTLQAVTEMPKSKPTS